METNNPNPPYQPYGQQPYGNGQQPPMPPYQQSGAPYPAPPQNYLVWAILSTICCSPIFGIVSIVFASQVNSKFRAGDVAGAMEASRKAKTWAIVAAVVGVVCGFIGFLVGLAEALG